MSDQRNEIEVKYYVSNLEKVENRIHTLGVNLIQPRTFEYNILFDTPDGKLTESLQILRLRRDSRVRLTYKGPGRIVDGVHSRPEIEFTVSNFDHAKDFLEALNYQVKMVYEKYRAVYDLDGVHITLDELPYGNFIEIEGPDAARIKNVSSKIRLKWDERIVVSYSRLFQVVCTNLDMTIDNLTFSNFTYFEVTPDILGIRPADE
jgi:adenylate cyclase class 2